MTTGFLHEKKCPSLDTYPSPAGGLLKLMEGWNMGDVQYDGWPEPPPVAECSGPRPLGTSECILKQSRIVNLPPHIASLRCAIRSKEKDRKI